MVAQLRTEAKYSLNTSDFVRREVPLQEPLLMTAGVAWVLVLAQKKDLDFLGLVLQVTARESIYALSVGDI